MRTGWAKQLGDTSYIHTYVCLLGFVRGGISMNVQCIFCTYKLSLDWINMQSDQTNCLNVIILCLCLCQLQGHSIYNREYGSCLVKVRILTADQNNCRSNTWLFFSFILLIHRDHVGRSTRNSNPVKKSSAGCAKGCSYHRFRAPPPYTAQLLTLQQHRAKNQHRTANQS